jgi:endoglucanase
MDDERREFLESLLETATPSGYERAGQRVWIDYVSDVADDVRTDAYGNAVAVLEGGDDTIALAGHADEIGYIVRDVEDDGFVRLASIGGADRTVSQGQHVTIHADDGPVPGVVGQTAIHLRDADEESLQDVGEQFVDVGAIDADEAEELVERGDPVTVEQRIRELANGRLSARGMDNRIGIWTAAEAFRRTAAADPEATVYAVSTVQEEVGLRGAQMVGFDLDPDAVVAVDVTNATDSPAVPADRGSGVELSAGPTIKRGSTNHPGLVEAARAAAGDEGIDVQLEASGSRTGTDADAFYTARGGIPSLSVGVPNRYMHTPVEVVDPADLEAAAALLSAVARRGQEFSFGH